MDRKQKTPLRKANRGEGIVSIKPRPKRAYDCFGLLYSFIDLHDICVVPWTYVIYFVLPPLLNGRCTSLLRVVVSEMTYTVSSATLNSSIPYLLSFYGTIYSLLLKVP